MPDPGVYIAPGQMYQELRTLSDGMTRMETKLDGIVHGLSDVGKDLTDHETRIRALERRVWTASGVATVLGAGAGVLAQALLR
ncbi:hypothetical protein [Streptomyces sp. NPDC002547]